MRTLILSLMASFTLGGATASADPVVVELFTSQGCSSCPPADELLGDLAAREDVLALSLHVDYWDWIGWSDTFAKPAFSERQRAYAENVRSNVVYTPQFVIGGTDQVAGVSGMKMADLLEVHGAVSKDMLRIASTADGREVVAMPGPGAGALILVGYIPEATVRVLAGENAGKEITYHNVVVSWDELADWNGDEVSVPIPPAAAGLRQAVIAQSAEDGRPGEILGAVRVD